ncbi:MAG: hypothetical protein CM15mP115_00570 [Alphaproteobacteria bacterium]|nr:MAG: hypothetical protein CM15mP115_00570 [Alphaproteobacteria bacterium]
MAIDRSFFSVTAQGVDALAGAAGADIVRGADRQAVDAAPGSEAGPGHLCFLTEKADKTLIARLSGAVVITTPALAEELPEDCAALVCGNPRLGFARALGLMVPRSVPAIHRSRRLRSMVSLSGITSALARMFPSERVRSSSRASSSIRVWRSAATAGSERMPFFRTVGLAMKSG